MLAEEGDILAILQFFPSLSFTVDHMEAESSKTKVKIMEEMQRKYDQLMENKDRNHQEYVRQLIEKMDKDRAQQVAEQEKMMTRMLQVFCCVIPTFSPTGRNKRC